MEKQPLKLFNLNTYNCKFLDSNILPFIKEFQPDIFLVQEVFKNRLSEISQAMNGAKFFFSPLCFLSLDGGKTPPEEWGIAVFSKSGFIKAVDTYYRGSRDKVRENLNNKPSHCRSIITATIEANGLQYNVATTHFTWSARGEITKGQLKDFKKMQIVLDQNGGLVIAGDFNSPRGKEIFDSLAKRYQDNISQKAITTLDPTVRPEITWNHVVDGLFTSPKYKCESVELISGLSDHLGIYATISLVNS